MVAFHLAKTEKVMVEGGKIVEECQILPKQFSLRKTTSPNQQSSVWWDRRITRIQGLGERKDWQRERHYSIDLYQYCQTTQESFSDDEFDEKMTRMKIMKT